MSYQHDLLGLALGWKYNHTPGICTRDNYLTQWPDRLGALPDESAQAQIVLEYQTYLTAIAMQPKPKTLEERVSALESKTGA